MAVVLAAGGWDLWVSVIQALPGALSVLVVAALLIFLAPELKRRIGNADIEVEIAGNRVKLSEASNNIVNVVTDLQDQVRQLVAEREDQLKAQSHLAEQEAEAQPKAPAPPAPEAAPSEGGKGAGPGGSAPTEGGKGAGPGGPGPSATFPGSLVWIDRNPGEHTIERTQLQRARWVIHQFGSLDEAARAFSGLTNIEPRAIVVVLAPDTALGEALAKLGQLPAAPVFVYGPNLSYGAPGIARVGGAFVTSSAVELLSALTETRCGQCGVLMPEPGNLRADRRTPCPVCGSVSRHFSRTLEGPSTTDANASGN